MLPTDLQEFSHDGVTILARTSPHTSGTDRGVFIEVSDDRFYFWNSIADVKRATDIGAHIGSWSVWVKHIYPNAEVIAVELERDNYRVACGNLADRDGVFLYHARMGYDPDARMGHHVDTGSHLVLSPSVTVRGVRDTDITPEPLRVPTVGLETLLNLHGWDEVDVVKLDCEGSEIDLFANAPEDTLLRVKCFVGERHQPIDEFRRLVGARLEGLFEVEYRDHPSAPHLGFFCAKRR